MKDCNKLKEKKKEGRMNLAPILKEAFKKMRRKYFLVILLLILAIFLNGCGGLVTPDTDEAKIKEVIQNYALASLEGHKEVVELLINKGADVNAKDDFEGGTASLYAYIMGHEDIGGTSQKAWVGRIMDKEF